MMGCKSITHLDKVYKYDSIANVRGLGGNRPLPRGDAVGLWSP